MNRFNNNGKIAWSGHRPDTFAKGASRRPNFNIRRNEVFQRQPIDDDDLEGRLLDKMEKFDQWKEETDRRFESWDPMLSRDTEPPLWFDAADDGEYDEFRRRKSEDKGYRNKNPSYMYRDVRTEERGRREERGKGGSGWDGSLPTNRYARTQSGGWPQRFDKPPSCWDPPQRYQSSATGYDNSQVSMKPPRFDGTNASNWISRVQSYFNHSMIPDAQRLHYAVMLFDQPAADWVFNYLANNDFVTWQDFLEDVRDRFDRQGTKPVMKERLQLHRPLSSRVLELTDTHVDRTLQPPSSTTSRRPWQNREGRGQVESTPAQQSSQPFPTPIQTQRGPGRAVDQARPPRVRVSQAEKAERARLGLCYYCPDKWLVSHVCKQRLLCYSDENDLDENGENDLDENGENEDEYDENDLDGSNLSSTTTDSTSSEEHLMVLGESDTSSSTDSASRGKNISNSSMCSQNCTNIDHLEEITADARNIKKTLFMEMESVINLMKQAEVKEHAAEQANTEAARVEMDAQNEIKELKITIKHATEASGCIGKGISRVLIIKKLCGVGKTFAMDLFLKRACVDNTILEHATYECMFMALLCEGSYKGRHSTVRYVFDPGGDASPKLSTIIVASWFPP